jgi:hypothetical protein
VDRRAAAARLGVVVETVISPMVTRTPRARWAPLAQRQKMLCRR